MANVNLSKLIASCDNYSQLVAEAAIFYPPKILCDGLSHTIYSALATYIRMVYITNLEKNRFNAPAEEIKRFNSKLNVLDYFFHENGIKYIGSELIMSGIQAKVVLLEEHFNGWNNKFSAYQCLSAVKAIWGDTDLHLDIRQGTSSLIDGAYSPKFNLLFIKLPSLHTLINTFNVDEDEEQMVSVATALLNEVDGTITHELSHMMQTIVSYILYKHKNKTGYEFEPFTDLSAGLPKHQTSTNFIPELGKPKEKTKEEAKKDFIKYKLSDVEFQPTLISIITSFNTLYGNLPLDKKEKMAKEWVSIPYDPENMTILDTNRNFFTILKDEARTKPKYERKYRDAVKKFFAEVLK